MYLYLNNYWFDIAVSFRTPMAWTWFVYFFQDIKSCGNIRYMAIVYMLLFMKKSSTLQTRSKLVASPCFARTFGGYQIHCQVPHELWILGGGGRIHNSTFLCTLKMSIVNNPPTPQDSHKSWAFTFYHPFGTVPSFKFSNSMTPISSLACNKSTW